jgi:hypothetical protein
VSASAKTPTHLSSAVAGSATDVYTFAKSEEIFAEAQEVRREGRVQPRAQKSA